MQARKLKNVLKLGFKSASLPARDHEIVHRNHKNDKQEIYTLLYATVRISMMTRLIHLMQVLTKHDIVRLCFGYSSAYEPAVKIT